MVVCMHIDPQGKSKHYTDWSGPQVFANITFWILFDKQLEVVYLFGGYESPKRLW